MADTAPGLAPADSSAPASNPTNTAATEEASKISADEIALYDRQIRLWGVQAQEKIRTAKILVVSLKALANEVAKNLILAGISSITLADHELVTEQDLGAHFFLSEADVGKNRAEAAAPQLQKLNPRVRVTCISSDIRNEQGPTFYTQYDVIVATDMDFISFYTLNTAANLARKPFYAGASHGLYGYIFVDLVEHDFVIEREKSNRTTTVGAETATRSVTNVQVKKENGKLVELVSKREIYSPMILAKDGSLPTEISGNTRRLKKVHPLLTCIRTLWEYQRQGLGLFPTHNSRELELFTTMAKDKHRELFLPPETLTPDFMRSFLQNLGSELAPVTAFLGGQLAQDIINVLGQREQPVQNLMLFDGEDSAGPIYTLLPRVEVTNMPIIPSEKAEAAIEVE